LNEWKKLNAKNGWAEADVAIKHTQDWKRRRLKRNSSFALLQTA
jgi:hypothetical protein